MLVIGPIQKSNIANLLINDKLLDQYSISIHRDGVKPLIL